MRICVIDGGADRGIIPVVGLMAAETEFGKPVQEIFDLFIGTSTGGLIAWALAVGRTPRQLYDLYLEGIPKIFSPTTLRSIRTMGGAVGSKYDSTVLAGFVRRTFGDWSNALVTNVRYKAASTTYNLTDDTLEIVTNWGHVQSSGWSVFDAAMATSAAPVGFDPHLRMGKLYADGGLFAGNPALLVSGIVDEDIPLVMGAGNQVLSFGTGVLNKIDPPRPNYGALQWVFPLIEIHGYAFGVLVDNLMKEKFGKAYVRANPTLHGIGYSAPDPANLPTMVREANSYFHNEFDWKAVTG